MRHSILFSVLAAAALVTGCSGSKDAPGFQIGLQLYSVRQDLQKDFRGTLQKVRDLGYDGVEFYNEFAGYTPEQVRALCDSLGLAIFSNHVPIRLLMTDPDRVIAESRVLGMQYITIPSMPARPGADPEGFKQTVAAIGEVGRKVREAGFGLLYHNHDFEFALLPDGTVGHDYMFASTDPADVGVELDVCWADYAGADVPDLVRKYAGRLPVLHMKDYYQAGKSDADPYALVGEQNTGGGRRGFEYRPLGKGVVDLAAVLDAARQTGVAWLCVEQDEPSAGAADRFEGPAISVRYLRENL